MMNCGHRRLPVAASSRAIQSRTPVSPLAAPTMILSLMASGAAVKVTSGVSENEVSQTTLPVSLSVAMMRGELPKTAGTGDDEVARQRRAAAAHLAILLGVHAPHDAAEVAGAGVDLVEDVPGIRDVEETVFGERRCVGELVARAAAERHRVGEF